MEIVKLNKKQLKNFIESDDYEKMDVLPISKHRAVSHINNPRAFDNDVLLILAYEKDKLVGYLGVLPDNLDNGEHVGWLSCIWTSPIMRGKGIAKKLVEIAHDCYNRKIFITNYTYEAGVLYNKLGFFIELKEMEGKRYYRKMCLSLILPERFYRFKNFKTVLKAIDISFNLIWNVFLDFEKAFFKLKNAEIIKTKYDDNEFIYFLNKYNFSSFKRSHDEFKWMFDFPWIKETKNFSSERFKYNFSSEEKKFKQDVFKVKLNSDTIAFIVTTFKNKHLKFPYIFFKKELKNYDVLNSSLKYLAIYYDCHYCSIFSSVNIKLKILRIFSKKIKRRFLISKGVEYYNNHLIIYDGDGDSFFT